MRRTLRLFAAVKPARYLEPGAPTGLTGLFTHPSPRSTLLYLYTRTLEKLQEVPESSLYRQSVEALTKHRLAIVEAAEPPGYAEWVARARKIAEENPTRFTVSTGGAGQSAEGSLALQLKSGGKLFVYRTEPAPRDDREEEWNGERDEGPGSEGLKGAEERGEHEYVFSRPPTDSPDDKVTWEPEPQLTADQIEEIESKIGGGLIEEVVRVAENELRLVDIMQENKVWEELEEKPAEGQWTYFERDSQ
ncbi:ETC complex I subunit conserved region-domain-containing protein [Daldinia vernicosa]|uniref:ETC complex I subunit conserved region-domain-containing protein n=1 Tax=Daldinia vernicosa TaxID=114800 RepID=UPI0020073554|nr:ETC complex I subunit conserved region-domain-containing protein [Daldinia vernicosa]KAI0852438.1 ETC complex I subunit conserved region-domain-containing protein [Daldinia vernicosa]